MIPGFTHVEQRKALRAFKKRGVTVHVGALENLFTAFQQTGQLDFATFLDGAFDLLSRPDGAPDGILTKQLAKTIGERLTRESHREDGDLTASIDVIDTFTIPRWRPRAVASHTASSGHRVDAPRRPVIDAPPEAKSDMFRTRFELMLSKTMRSEIFSAPLSNLGALSNNKTYHHITNIDSLEPEKGNCFVLGLLTQLEEGSWFLEDLNGSIRIDLSSAKITSGLHTDGSIVLAYGSLFEDDDIERIFRVKAMGNPNPETREATIDALGKDANLFGGHFEPTNLPKLLKMEQEAEDTFFVLLSDVALDSSRVMAALRYLFQSYVDDGFVPTLMVLMGNFLSHPFGQDVDDVRTLCDKFGDLGEMIRDDFALIAKETTFVIIPGTNDPGPGNVLPRPAMPPMITRRFVEALGSERVHLGTNPCRIRYMTQEMVLLRDDLVQKMLRHCAIKPDVEQFGPVSQQFVKTIIDQSYLCPLVPSARPVLWRHDHALWLFPTPHTVVIADRVDSFSHEYAGCLGLNPGSFATDFSFQVYLPAKREGHISSIDSEEVNGEKEDKLAEVENTDASDDVSSLDPPAEEATEKAEGSENDDDDEDDVAEPAELSADEESEKDEAGNESDVEKNEEQEDDDDKDVSDAESDDSVLVPVKGIKKIDIKAMVRESLRDSVAMPGTADSDESDDEDQDQNRDETRSRNGFDEES